MNEAHEERFGDGSGAGPALEFPTESMEGTESDEIDASQARIDPLVEGAWGDGSGNG